MLPWEDYRTVEPFDLVKMDMMLISFQHFDKCLSKPQTILMGRSPSHRFHIFKWCRVGVQLDDFIMAMAEEVPSMQVTKTCLQAPIARVLFSDFFVTNLSMRRRMQHSVCVIERHWQRKKAMDVLKPVLRRWIRRQMHKLYLPGGRLMPQRSFSDI